MLNPSSPKSILIVEPNSNLDRPYSLLDQNSLQLTKVSSTLVADECLQKQAFDLVFLSCSFSNKKILNFLESLKEASKGSVIPLVLMVDFSQPYSIVPGLTWDNKIALLGSNCTAKDLELQLSRLL